MQEIGRGAKVFDAAPVRGRFLPMEAPDDVLELMDDGAEGVVALVRDAGATFLAPDLPRAARPSSARAARRAATSGS